MEVPDMAVFLRTLPHLEGLSVERVDRDEAGITTSLRAMAEGTPCPACQQASPHVHSAYGRTVAALPWSGLRVRLRVRSRRFRCHNASCPRKIFCERLPALVPVYGRRTHRCGTALLTVGVALGGRPGGRLLPALALVASRTTLLRLVRATPATPEPTRAGVAPAVLGVDEWAFRRRPPARRFGTILVDLVRHRPVDLLREATAGAFARWLRAHPGARVISRDRGGAFADGAQQGAPQARQVADRFHLLRHLGNAVKRVLQRHAHAVERVPAPELARPPASAPADQGRPLSRATSARSARPDRRASRERTKQARRERYEAVQQLAATGMTTSAIARALRLHRHTVQKYRPLSAPPERRHTWRLPSLLAPYEGYLLERWRQGCHNAMALWHELEQRGFPGKYRTVARLVADWKALARTGAPVPPPPAGLTPRQATALLLLRPQRRTTPEQRAVEQVSTVHPEIHTAVTLFDRFARLLRQAPTTTAKARAERLTRLARWIADATRCGLGEVEAFTTKLRQDLSAVQAAFTLPYSQGQTEGQITRLKALKRQMFGRANFDLLRQRFLLSAATSAPP